MNNYIKINQESWNNRLQAHLDSDFYNMPEFLQGKSSLNAIELNLLGDIKEKSILHLQCHFGQDTISLSQLGAQATGVDLSNKSIDKAKEITKNMGLDTQFICCDIYELPKHLNKEFDIIFTSYGTISWLPNLDKWAQVISSCLKDNGKFVFVEFHPFVWMYDEQIKKIEYPYFNRGPILEEESGTYADRNAKIKQKYVCWNHSISEVTNSLIESGLIIRQLNEYDYSPYKFISGLNEFEPEKYNIENKEGKIPLVYSICAEKAKNTHG